MKFGLPDEVLAEIRAVLAKYPLAKAVVFGSRARGDHRPNSDIDIAVWPKEGTADRVAMLAAELDGLDIIYKIDLLEMRPDTDPALAAKVARDGREM